MSCWRGGPWCGHRAPATGHWATNGHDFSPPPISQAGCIMRRAQVAKTRAMCSRRCMCACSSSSAGDEDDDFDRLICKFAINCCSLQLAGHRPPPPFRLIRSDPIRSAHADASRSCSNRILNSPQGSFRATLSRPLSFVRPQLGRCHLAYK